MSLLCQCTVCLCLRSFLWELFVAKRVRFTLLSDTVKTKARRRWTILGPFSINCLLLAFEYILLPLPNPTSQFGIVHVVLLDVHYFVSFHVIMKTRSLRYNNSSWDDLHAGLDADTKLQTGAHKMNTITRLGNDKNGPIKGSQDDRCTHALLNIEHGATPHALVPHILVRYRCILLSRLHLLAFCIELFLGSFTCINDVRRPELIPRQWEQG